MSSRHSASSRKDANPYPSLQIRPNHRYYPQGEPRAHVTQQLSPPAQHPQRNARAVLIGINYFGQKGEMRQRVDEARNLANYLKQCKGYAPEDIVLLTDDQMGPFGQPTRRNIIAALQWLGDKAYPGEKLLFYYTGHGRINARGITEESKPGVIGCDSETIFPVDFRQRGEISPPELESKLREAQRKGVKLTLILDTHTAGFENNRHTQSPTSATSGASGTSRS